jgi:hypothetical protein
MGTLRVLAVLAVLATHARADVLIATDPPVPEKLVKPEEPAKPAKPTLAPRTAIGWSYFDESLHFEGRDGVLGLGVGLSVARGFGAWQLRAEGSTVVTTGGSMEVAGHGHRVGAALRYLPLEAVIGNAREGSGFALAVDAGAGHMWWYDDLGGVRGAYAMVGVAGTMTKAGMSDRSQHRMIIVALGSRMHVMADGWMILGGVEVGWGN